VARTRRQRGWSVGHADRSDRLRPGRRSPGGHGRSLRRGTRLRAGRHRAGGRRTRPACGHAPLRRGADRAGCSGWPAPGVRECVALPGPSRRRAGSVDVDAADASLADRGRRCGHRHLRRGRGSGRDHRHRRRERAGVEHLRLGGDLQRLGARHPRGGRAGGGDAPGVQRRRSCTALAARAVRGRRRHDDRGAVDGHRRSRPPRRPARHSGAGGGDGGRAHAPRQGSRPASRSALHPVGQRLGTQPRLVVVFDHGMGARLSGNAGRRLGRRDDHPALDRAGRRAVAHRPRRAARRRRPHGRGGAPRRGAPRVAGDGADSRRFGPRHHAARVARRSQRPPDRLSHQWAEPVPVHPRRAG
jgi:hypothetical protein